MSPRGRAIPPALEALLVPVASLRPHPRNYRLHDDDGLIESLRTHGQFRPVVCARGGVLLAGHGVYHAACALGWTDIAAVPLDLDPDAPSALAIMVADNRYAERGADEQARLSAILIDLYKESDLVGTGYSTVDLSDLLASLQKQSERALNLGRQTASPPAEYRVAIPCADEVEAAEICLALQDMGYPARAEKV